jgi:hypothetical protein
MTAGIMHGSAEKAGSSGTVFNRLINPLFCQGKSAKIVSPAARLSKAFRPTRFEWENSIAKFLSLVSGTNLLLISLN